MKFWIPWAIDALIAALAVFFFPWGLADGSVSTFNIGLWMLLLVLAVPGVLVGLFFLILIVGNPRWN